MYITGQVLLMSSYYKIHAPIINHVNACNNTELMQIMINYLKNEWLIHLHEYLFFFTYQMTYMMIILIIAIKLISVSLIKLEI